MGQSHPRLGTWCIRLRTNLLQPSKLRQLYNRPAYFHIQGIPDIKVGDMHSLVYTSRKWFGISVNILNSKTFTVSV